MISSSPSLLVLASGSPRRRELLQDAGLEFEILPAELEEVFRAGRSPEENAGELARLKADWAAARRPECFVLAADTLVAVDGRLLGKPRDRGEARRMLRQLSGRSHQVITGLACHPPGGPCLSETVASTVTFKPLSEERIEAYLDTGEYRDKAGAYAIQGAGGDLVQSCEGSFSNVVGLPVEQTLALLRRCGFPEDRLPGARPSRSASP